MQAQRVLPALAIAALALTALAAPASAAGTTRWVDDDGRAGPAGCAGNGVAKKTIQAAVNAAKAGDTVIVCPGEYTESVTVGAAKDGLSIVGATFWSAKIIQPDDETGSGSYLLGIRPGAKNVLVRGLVFVAKAPQGDPAGQVNSCWLDAAITVQGTDATILSNRINGRGFTSGPCGYETGIRVGAGIGIAGTAPAPSATVSHNAVRDFYGQGITAVGEGVTATIERNSIRYWHLDEPIRQPVAASGRRSSVRWNLGTSPAGPGRSGAGIALGQGAGGTIYGNEVSSGPNAGANLAGASLTPLLGAAITIQRPDPTLISQNTIHRAYAGIALVDARGTKVRANVVTDAFYGILLAGVQNAGIRNNQVGPGFFGITIEQGLQPVGLPESSGNRVISNTSLGNQIVDCNDDTIGSGTAGTANTWSSNTGLTSDPSGLCTIL